MVVVASLVFLFEALTIVVCLHNLYDEKVRFDLVTTGYIALDVALMDAIYFSTLGQVWTLLIYPFMVLYCGLRFGFKLKTIFVNIVLNVAIISILQTSIIVLCNVILDIERPEVWDNLFINVAMFGIIILGLKKWKINKLSGILQSNEKITILSVAIVTVSIIIFTLSYKQNGGFDVLYYVVFGVSIMLIVIAAVDIGKHKIKAKEAEAELRIYKLYEPSFRELVEDIRARQHEFDNHINAIYSQHYNYKTYDKLVAAQRKYCSEVVKENRYNKLLSHGDHAVTSFLYSRFLEAEKRGIEVSYRVCIEELECGVPVHKLVELLGNLVNNAMDEAEKSGKGRICVTLLEERERIRITVSNESEAIEYKRIPELFKRGYSEKGKNRGYGLYNVKKICEDYGIEIACDNKSIEGEDGLTFNLTIEKSLEIKIKQGF